jgi:hypothetical protein
MITEDHVFDDIGLKKILEHAMVDYLKGELATTHNGCHSVLNR